VSTPRAILVLSGLAMGLAAAGLAAAALGAVSIPAGSVADMLLRQLGLPIPVTWTPTDESILLQVRLPRVATAILVGAALAEAGVIFQGLLRNPMADPYIIGTSGGAALGATVAMMLPLLSASLPASLPAVGAALASLPLPPNLQDFWASALGFSPVPVLAFLGALASVMVVYNLARVGPRTPVVTLLLAGFATSSLLAAVMSFLMLISGSALQRIVFWTMGGLAVLGWSQIAVVGPLILGSIIAVYPLAWDLNVFLLGEEEAANLGVNVERRKLYLLILGSLLTGAAIALSGLVGFVGLVIPHVTRLLLGPDHRLLLPASAMVGAIFLLLADLVARTIMAPTEMPVGIITALVGAPLFIYLLRKGKRDYVF
jgi:iron complex transport system permease protein